MNRPAFGMLAALLSWTAVSAPPIATPAAAQDPQLSNAHVRAELGPRGLTSITDLGTGREYRFERDDFTISVDGRHFRSVDLPAPSRTGESGRVRYAWTAGPYGLEVVYEVRPDGRFVSKRIRVTTAPASRFRVDSLRVFEASLAEAPAEVFVPRTRYRDLGTGDYGGALRFADGHGLLVVVQNPFLRFEREGRDFGLSYAPDMEWRTDYGPFPADLGLLAPYRLTGRRIPAQPVPEWRLAEPDTGTTMDRAEVETFTNLVRAFLLYDPEEPVDVYVAWTANDYQIDIGRPEGRAEYKRMLEVVADVGAEHVVFAPTNSGLSRRAESTDAWLWENLLWLGLGQKIRKDEWDPKTGELPGSVREMLEFADSLGLKLMAYVYPVLPFSQNPEWLVPVGDREYANLGFRSLQDWLIENLIAFKQRTGVSGYAFDYTFLTYPGPGQYAQWWGWRRVMEELRRREPDIVMDGRQSYHLYGPWTWLAGSYPHPTLSDEQPESFVNFPDLHFDRVSANRQRYTAYLYRNHEFTPTEIMPGYLTHQTPRNDDTGRMPQVETDDEIVLLPFRKRDWDHLGWRYSVISSIATAGWANVVSMLPGRDSAEYRHFSDQDRAWLRGWLEWTETNKDYLRNTRTILGQPAIGRVDGTSALLGDRGFLFLFNPNGRRMAAELTLDETIGLEEGDAFLLRELYPLEGRLVGKPAAGVWRFGDRVAVPLDGGSARVLEIEPLGEPPASPTLFGATGTVAIAGTDLVLEGVRGEAGTMDTLLVVMPPGPEVRGVLVNGQRLPFDRTGGDLVSIAVRWAGQPFRKLQAVGDYDPGFTGGTFRARFTIPTRIFEQLERRQAVEWPIPWRPEDYRATWLAPQRLLLFAQIAEPDPEWDVRLRLDGKPIELRRQWSSIRAHPRTFVGFWADVSLLSPDREYEVELELPELRPGQFQGLFFENVETEYTDALATGSATLR